MAASERWGGAFRDYCESGEIGRSISALVLFRKTTAFRAGLNSGVRLLSVPRIETGNEMELSAQAYTAWQDEAQRERLLMLQLPQVRYIARRIHERLPRHVPLEDLVHAGVVGLIDALHKYDRNKHVQFGSYAKFRIRGAILDSLREMDWSPRDLRRKARRLQEAHSSLSGVLGRSPTEPELAAELGMDLHNFQALLT